MKGIGYSTKIMRAYGKHGPPSPVLSTLSFNLASPTPAPISNEPAIRFVNFSNRGLRAVLSARPASCA